MLPADQDRVVIVLVRARNPSNIGAVARAMQDFGFRHLRIVNEFAVPFQAAKSAVDAASVLAAASEHHTVAAAVADCTLVLGTTAVGERVLQHPVETAADAAAGVRRHLHADPGARVALLFGSEKTGLSNDELSHCHRLLTIPMSAAGERHLSMNLGQAVAVCLYELARSDSSALPTPPAVHPASAGDLERATQLLAEVLERSGYARRNPAQVREESLRRLVRRMLQSAPDAVMLQGVLRQILHALAGQQKPDADT